MIQEQKADTWIDRALFHTLQFGSVVCIAFMLSRAIHAALETDYGRLSGYIGVALILGIGALHRAKLVKQLEALSAP